MKEEEDDSESIINQITLDCLLNKTQYEKYLQRNLTKSINKNDKKFYRKRICNLTKELFKEENTISSPDINYVFDNYLRLCINYFKVLDRSDIIQEEYKEFINESVEACSNNEELSLSNTLLMRSIKVNPGLDNFVTVKMIKKPEEMIIPQQRDINLRDPKLRRKGIVEKEKKNITIKYDDQEEKKNELKTEKEEPKEIFSPTEEQQTNAEAKV
jgi:hypothetical protein